MKGITPVVAIVILLIITVAVVGMGYGFISGFIETITGKTAIISGVASCITVSTSTWLVIPITNAGTGTIDINPDGGDVLPIRRSGRGFNQGGTFLDDLFYGRNVPTITDFCWDINKKHTKYPLLPLPINCPLEPGSSGEIWVSCDKGDKCNFDISVGGITFPVAAKKCPS